MTRRQTWIMRSVAVCCTLFLTSCAAMKYPTVSMLQPARLSLGGARSIYVEPFTAADSSVPESLVRSTHQAYLDVLRQHNPAGRDDSLRFVQAPGNADILVSGIMWCDYRADSEKDRTYNSRYKTETKTTSWHRVGGRKIGPARKEELIVRIPGDLTASATIMMGLRVYERDTGNIRFGTVRVEVPKSNVRKEGSGTLPTALELQRPLAHSLARQTASPQENPAFCRKSWRRFRRTSHP